MSTRTDNFVSAVIIGLVSLVIFISGCAKKDTDPAAGAENKTAALFPFPVTLNPVDYPFTIIAIAKEEGYYEDYGLDVQLLPVSGAAEQLNGVASGKLKLTNSGASIPLLLIDGNPSADVVFIGGTMTGSGAFISRVGDAGKYRPITTEALAGKKIAVIRGSAADIAFRGGLLEKGVDLSKVDFIELDAHATSVTALLKGEVDLAVIGAPFREAAKNQGAEIIYHIDEIAPNYVCCRVTTSKKNLAENRQRYVDYFKAQIRAYKVFKTDENKALDYAEKYFTIDRNTLQKELYEIGHISLNPDPATNALKELYNRLKLIGVAGSNLDLDKYIDLSVYEEALDSIIGEEPNEPFYQELKQDYFRNNEVPRT